MYEAETKALKLRRRDDRQVVLTTSWCWPFLQRMFHGKHLVTLCNKSWPEEKSCTERELFLKIIQNYIVEIENTKVEHWFVDKQKGLRKTVDTWKAPKSRHVSEDLNQQDLNQ